MLRLENLKQAISKENIKGEGFRVPTDKCKMKAVWMGWPYHDVYVEPWCPYSNYQ